MDWDRKSMILNSYGISDIDESGDPKYYGYLGVDGTWYIMQNTGGTAYRYARGASGYTTAWTGRAALTYYYFNLVFTH